MHDFQFDISLRLWHPNRTIDRLIPKGLRASTLHNVGEPKRTPGGKALTGAWKESYCCVDLQLRGTSPLEPHVVRWLSELAPYAEFFKNVRDEGGRVELFIGLFDISNNGISFAREVLEKIAVTGLDVSFDLYAKPQRDGP